MSARWTAEEAHLPVQQQLPAPVRLRGRPARAACPPDATAEQMEAKFHASFSRVPAFHDQPRQELQPLSERAEMFLFRQAGGLMRWFRPSRRTRRPSYRSHGARALGARTHRHGLALRRRSTSTCPWRSLGRKNGRGALREQLRMHKLAMDGYPTDEEIHEALLTAP